MHFKPIYSHQSQERYQFTWEPCDIFSWSIHPNSPHAGSKDTKRRPDGTFLTCFRWVHWSQKHSLLFILALVCQSIFFWPLENINRRWPRLLFWPRRQSAFLFPNSQDTLWAHGTVGWEKVRWLITPAITCHPSVWTIFHFFFFFFF